MVHLDDRDNLLASVFPPNRQILEIEHELPRLGGECFYLLSHLIGPEIGLWMLSYYEVARCLYKNAHCSRCPRQVIDLDKARCAIIAKVLDLK